MPLKYYDEAFRTIVFLTNRLPTPVLDNRSPFESLYLVKLDYFIIKVFGCLCFPNTRPFNPHKLAFRSVPCTFIGYSAIFFHESSFPFITPNTASANDPSLSSTSIVQPVVSIPVVHTSSPDQCPHVDRSNLSNSSLSSADASVKLQPPGPYFAANDEETIGASDVGSQVFLVAQPGPTSADGCTNVHPMTTRSKVGIHKPKVYMAAKEPEIVIEALQVEH